MDTVNHIPTTHQQQQSSSYLLPTLRNVYTKSLSNTLSKCSYPAFAACFPTPAAKKPETLKTVWKQIVNKVEVKALTEFEAVCQERELDVRFAELEDLLKHAKSSKEQGIDGAGDGEGDGKVNGASGLHSLPPLDLFRATMAPYLVPINQQLEDQTKHQQARNEVLIKELLSKRTEIENVVTSLEDVIADMEAANKILYAASKDMENVDVD